MSRNILTKRPPASPNKPPPAPRKIPLKGQPVPIDVNLLVKGNYIERAEPVHTSKYTKYAGIAQITKLSAITDFNKTRPRTVHIDKHVLQTLTKSPSVDVSYYDRFERLDRDYVEGDTAYKEKGGRVKSAGKPRSLTPAPPRQRKRSKSASSSKTKKEKETFFDVAMSFDDETKVNTQNNAESQISKGSMEIKSMKPRPKSAVESRRRPRSGRKRRDRSASRRRSERSDSKSTRSIGSASWCSSRTSRSDKQQTKTRVRSSRSRTRQRTRQSDVPTNQNHRRNDAIGSKARPTSASYTKQKQVTSDYSDIGRRLSESASQKLERELILLSQVLEKNEHVRKNRHIANKPKSQKDAAIDAVRKANEAEETLKQMKAIDKLMYKEERRHVSSSFPKLKMIVAPSATPLATLVRHSSAKMLMGNAHEAKRNI